MRNISIILFLITYANYTFSDIENLQISEHNTQLQKTLNDIHQQSGIIFDINSELKETPITANIIAENWTIAIRELLEDFNRLETLNPDGTLQKVRILNRKTKAFIPSNPTSAPPPLFDFTE